MYREEWRAIRSHFEQVDQSERDSLFQAMFMTLMSPFCARDHNRQLLHHPAEENDANCVFLN